MKKLILLFALLSSLISAAEDIPLSDFIKFFRRHAAETTYASLDGVLQHRRKGEKMISMPIHLGIIIGPERSSGQIILNDCDAYLFSQAYRTGGESIVRQTGSLETMNNVGVMISDLTMGFLYYPVICEQEKTTLSMYVNCRVIDFQVPEDKGIVRGYISSEYGFPIRAEWFRPGEKEPYRTLECSDFAKENDLYYVKTIKTDGPGWRTRINFEKADVGVFDRNNPPDIIKKIDNEQKGE